MKIGIIGLQPRQIADVRKRTFNGHEVEFYDEKTYSQEKVSSFVRKMDKLVLLPGHAPKRVSEWIPKTKLLQTMAGGISSVVRLLETIPADASPEPLAPLRVNRPEPKLPEERPAPVDLPAPTVTIKPPKKLGQTIPQGRQSQYTWSPDHSIVHPNESGEHRYDLLDAALPGDVLRMARPKGVEYQVWRTRITSMRYAREKSKGQILEAHYYEEYVDLQVYDTGPTDESTGASTEVATGQPAAAEETVFTPVADESTTKVTQETPAAEQASETPTSSNPLHADFWTKAYIEILARNVSMDEAAAMADRALELFKARFTV